MKAHSDVSYSGEQAILDSKKQDHRTAVRKLVIVSAVCITFMILELLGGMLAHSLAIMSDAAHLLSDFSGFAISIVAILLG